MPLMRHDLYSDSDLHKKVSGLIFFVWTEVSCLKIAVIALVTLFVVSSPKLDYIRC